MDREAGGADTGPLPRERRDGAEEARGVEVDCAPKICAADGRLWPMLSARIGEMCGAWASASHAAVTAAEAETGASNGRG